MKTVKINFVGFWETFNKSSNFLVGALRKSFDVRLSDDPDYLFVSCFTNMFDFVNYPNAIRIFVCGEDLTPDFAFFDYYIGYGSVVYGDRYLYYPCFLYHETWTEFDLKQLSLEEGKDVLKSKTRFCDFIYGEDDKNHIRSRVFNLLNTYKHVDAFGTYLNNQPDGKPVSYFNLEEKIAAQRQCKFSIVVECEHFENYVTEKIHHALLGQTIPIYFGTESVSNIFNKRRFVYANDFRTDAELMAQIKRIDEDDELFLSMLCEKPFVDGEYVAAANTNLQRFLANIFSQEKPVAYRRAVLSKSLRRIERQLFLDNLVRGTLLCKIARRFHRRKIRKGILND